MTEDKRKYVSVREIDGRRGIDTPHERELKTVEEGKMDIFQKTDQALMKQLVQQKLAGKIENIGFDEDYTITFEFFPEVRVHVLYFNYEDEEDEAFSGIELQFLFSGSRVKWVPSEDLISLLDVALDYLEDLVEPEQKIYKLPEHQTDLLKDSIKQRAEPFEHLKREQLQDLADFVGGKIERERQTWILSRTFFPGIIIGLLIDEKTRKINIQCKGENIERINNYARDQLGIFLINHCLRFISITNPGVEMPDIVSKMFSFSYKKAQAK